MVPFEIGWNLGSVEPMVSLDYASNGIFLIDIFINLNTAYYDEKNEVFVYNYWKIYMKYFQFWFWVDLISIIPFEKILVATSANSNIAYLRGVKLLRLVRFTRLTKMLRFSQNSEKNPEAVNIDRPVVNLLVLVVQISFMCHLFACTWHYLTLINDNNWVTSFGFEDSSIVDTYVASLYYIMVTMLTVGYGDIHATNGTEIRFAIVVMLTGGVMFGALLSKVGYLIDKQNPRAKATKQKMLELREYLEGCNLPLQLQSEAKVTLSPNNSITLVYVLHCCCVSQEAYEYFLSKKSCFGEAEIIDELPRPIMIRLIHEIYAKDIQRVKLFKHYEKSFVADLLTNTRPYQALRGEELFSEGDVLNDIVFISSGIVAISKSDGKKQIIVGYSREGGFFGDFEYTKNTCCIATYTAATNVNLLAISHVVINHAIMTNLDAADRFKTDLETRYKRFTIAAGMSVQASINPTPPQTPIVAKALNKFLQRNALSKGAATKGGPPPPARESLEIWLDGVLRPRHGHGVSLFPNHSNAAAAADAFSVTELPTFKVVCLDEKGVAVTKELDAWTLAKAWVVLPKDTYKIYWDIFVGLFVITSVLIAPVDIAFNSNTIPGIIVPQIFTVVFLLDMAVSFRTAFHSKDADSYVIIPRQMHAHYLRSWFVVDFLSTIPIDIITAALSSSSDPSKANSVIKILRLFRLTKVARVFKLKIYFSRLEAACGIPSSLFDFLSLMAKVVAVGHFIACLWWGLCSAMSPPGQAWFDQFPDIVLVEDLRNAPVKTQYMWAFYWTIATLTTVGYGDVHASNTNERLLNIFVLFIGASVFGYIVANVAAVMESFNRKATASAERMLQISEYLKDKECPKELSLVILRHFQQLLALRNVFGGKEILSSLPVKIKNRILLIQYQSKLENIAVLKYIHNRSVCLYIFELMKPIFFQPGQTIISQGEPGTDILFFVSGSAIAFQHAEMPIRRKKKKKRINFVDDLSSSHQVEAVEPSPASYKAMDRLVESKQLSALDGAEEKEKYSRRGDLSSNDESSLDSKSVSEQLSLKSTWPILEEPDNNGNGHGIIRSNSGIGKASTSPSILNHSGRSSPGRKRTSLRISLRGLQRSNGGFANKSLDDSEHSHSPENFKEFERLMADEEELQRRRITIVGEVKPGIFIGHVALMDRTSHRVSVVSTTISGAYTLSAAEISRLIRVEPTVAVQFQQALASAIRDQSNTFGKDCASQRNAKFVNGLKKQYYSILTEKFASNSDTSSVPSTPRIASYMSLKRIKIHPASSLRRVSMKYIKKPIHSTLTASARTKLDSILSRNADAESDGETSKCPPLTAQKSHALTATFRLKDIKKLNAVASTFNEMLRLYGRHNRKLVKCRSTSDLITLATDDNNGYAPNLEGIQPSRKNGAWTETTEDMEIVESLAESVRKVPATAKRRRRQSFPSLDNAKWKTQITHLGLL